MCNFIEIFSYCERVYTVYALSLPYSFHFAVFGSFSGKMSTVEMSPRLQVNEQLKEKNKRDREEEEEKEQHTEMELLSSSLY